jgi:hypothetical protein
MRRSNKIAQSAAMASAARDRQRAKQSTARYNP